MKVVAKFAGSGVMSVAEVAELIGKHPQTVCKWCDEGTFRWMRHRDGSRGIDRGDVMDYLRANEQ